MSENCQFFFGRARCTLFGYPMIDPKAHSLACPSCQNRLMPRQLSSIQLYFCEDGCGGIWLGHREVDKLARRNSFTGEQLEQILLDPDKSLEVPDCVPAGAGGEVWQWNRAEGVRVFRNVEHICPRCRNTLLYRHCFHRGMDLEIDQCSKCGGWWIEAGRLFEIFAPGQEKAGIRQEAQDFFKILFEDKVANMSIVNHDTLEAAQTIVRIFRFLTPAAYFPGTPPV